MGEVCYVPTEIVELIYKLRCYKILDIDIDKLEPNDRDDGRGGDKSPKPKNKDVTPTTAVEWASNVPANKNKKQSPKKNAKQYDSTKKWELWKKRLQESEQTSKKIWEQNVPILPNEENKRQKKYKKDKKHKKHKKGPDYSNIKKFFENAQQPQQQKQHGQKKKGRGVS